MPYIFVLSWITLYQVLSYLLTEEGLSVKSACILCSVSMKWHRQTLLLTIQLYLQKYRDEIDDQSRPMFKRKPLPAVTSHLALVKFYCDWVPAWHHALYWAMWTEEMSGWVSPVPSQPAVVSISSNWRSCSGSAPRHVGLGILKCTSLAIPISSCLQLLSYPSLY